MILLALFLGLLAYELINFIVKTSKHFRNGSIPGPFPLPIIGNLHLIGKNVHKDFVSLSKQYGEVFAIYFGSQRFVVVSGAKSIKEVLIEKGTHFAGRPQGSFKLDIVRGRPKIT